MTNTNTNQATTQAITQAITMDVVTDMITSELNAAHRADIATILMFGDIDAYQILLQAESSARDILQPPHYYFMQSALNKNDQEMATWAKNLMGDMATFYNRVKNCLEGEMERELTKEEISLYRDIFDQFDFTGFKFN